MDKSSLLTLIAVKLKPDGLGQPVSKESKREVYCNLSSISCDEWYKAGQAGMNPQYRVTMFAHDYDGENTVELDGKRYAVYRTYMNRKDTIELYLERKAGI